MRRILIEGIVTALMSNGYHVGVLLLSVGVILLISVGILLPISLLGAGGT